MVPFSGFQKIDELLGLFLELVAQKVVFFCDVLAASLHLGDFVVVFAKLKDKKS